VNAVRKPIKSTGIQLAVVVTKITGLINVVKKNDLLPPRSQHVEIARVTEAGPKFR
jgi:hypothetical protein